MILKIIYDYDYFFIYNNIFNNIGLLFKFDVF